MKNEVIEIIAEELIGVVPIHKGPFISQAEARRCANHDNKNRFEVAERIAARIDSLYSGEVSEESLQQDFKDWLGWNDKEAPNEDDPDYYTYSWGRRVWINSQKYYKK